MMRVSGFELHFETTMLMEIVAFGWRAEMVACHNADREIGGLADLRRSKEGSEAASKTTHELRRADSVYSPERRAAKNPRENNARQRAKRTSGRSGSWSADGTETDVARRSAREVRAQK